MKIGVAAVSSVMFALALVTLTIHPPTRAGQDESGIKAAQAAATMDPSRLRGIKAAVADLEGGNLKIRSAALPVAAWHESYLDLLQKECGVQWETVAEHTGKLGIELRGYNDVMILEIEHRFGKGILEALQKKAEASFRKTVDG